MKAYRKLTVIALAIVLVLGTACCALADDRLYTSEPFRIPLNRIQDLQNLAPEGEVTGETGEDTEPEEEPEEVPAEEPEEEPEDEPETEPAGEDKPTRQKKDITITIKGATEKITYDGQEHAVNTYTVSCDDAIFDEMMLEVVEPFGATRKDCGVEKLNLSADNFRYNDSRVNATIKVKDGWLKILPAPLTITANDAEKTQGQADPEFTADVEGLFGDDTVTYEVHRAQHGEEPGEYEVAPVVAEASDNYKVEYVSGTLTILEGDDTEAEASAEEAGQENEPEAEPETQPEEEPAEEPAEEPTEEEQTEVENVPEKSVSFTITWLGEVAFGSTARYEATLTGYENTNYTLQWQQSEDGEHWTDLEGQNGMTMDLVITPENYTCVWRLHVLENEE